LPGSEHADGRAGTDGAEISGGGGSHEGAEFSRKWEETQTRVRFAMFPGACYAR
jgi:hypothetical protein